MDAAVKSKPLTIQNANVLRKWREGIHWWFALSLLSGAISLLVFSILFFFYPHAPFLAQLIFYVLVVITLSAVSRTLYRSINLNNAHFNCPHCGKYVPPFDDWICAHCDQTNRPNHPVPRNLLGGYSFIGKCQHCLTVPTAYICHHHDCGKYIFLDDTNDTKFAARKSWRHYCGS